MDVQRSKQCSVDHLQVKSGGSDILCVIKSEVIVCMSRNLPQGTTMHFPCLARAGSRFFKKNSAHISNLERSIIK